MRPGRPVFVVLTLFGLALLSPCAHGDGVSAASLVDTLRYDPDSPTARLVIDRLGRAGENGWKALASLAIDVHAEHPDLAARAATVLASAREPARMDQAGRLYDRLEDDHLHQVLVLGLARDYPRGAERLHAHLRRNGPGSLDLLRILAARGLPEEEIEAAIAHENLNGLATSLLAGRKPSETEAVFMPKARRTACMGLDPKATEAFVAAFEAEPLIPTLVGLAEVLRESDADAALGAHCLLMSVTGLEIGPDADLWRAWIAAQKLAYTRPDPVSKGAIAAAVRRAVHFLRQDLLADGVCYHAFSDARDSAMGATALAVLALRAAGVPADDPAIAKGVDTTMLVFDRGGRAGLKAFSKRWETYGLSILAMALKRLGRERMKDALIAVRDRLVDGVLANGQWTYTCPAPAAVNRPSSGDNSNTQFANLGIRALRASGVELPARLWEVIDTHWRSTQHADGAWGYHASGRDSRKHPVQMTASGVAGIAIAHEGEDSAGAAARVGKDASVLKGLRWMGRSMMLTDFHLYTPYTLYAIERACVLTKTGTFAGGGKALDWYREGAWRFLTTQNTDGSWGAARIRHWESQGFGKVTSTAFALLFLTKATATIGEGHSEKVVAVSVTPETVATPPPNRSPDPDASTVKPIPWVLAKRDDAVAIRLEEETLVTRDGEVEIRGQLLGPWVKLFVDGHEAPSVDPVGRFVLHRTATEPGGIELVATARRGEDARKTVIVKFDTTPPKISLNGPAVRHAGKQRLLIESGEPLDGVKVGRYYFPADGRKAWVTAELGEHTKKLVVNAFDRVGNKTRAVFPVEVRNRVLILDGSSSLRVSLPQKPEYFTLECWVRSPPVDRHRWILADAEHAGMGILFVPGDGPVPGFGFHTDKEWLARYAKRPAKKDRWTHLALTYDGAHVRLWVNGKTAAEIETTTYRRSGKALLVGAEPDRHNRPRSPLIGAIDEVRFSSVCRYTKTFKPAFSHAADRHTVVLLHFDTDTEKAILDASGRHHHGTPVGNPKIVAEKR